ncbi:MAG: bL35 family ribosomal protein [Microgenomates group bacterium]
MAKTKVKTKQLVTNRIRVTKNGKVLRRKAFKRHLNASKSKNRLNRLSRVTPVKKVLARRLRKFLGKVLKGTGK